MGARFILSCWQFLAIHAKRTSSNNKNGKKSNTEDQSKALTGMIKTNIQRINNHPNKVKIKAELMSRRQNPATMYGSSP